MPAQPVGGAASADVSEIMFSLTLKVQLSYQQMRLIIALIVLLFA